jgi:hypothetical protein
LFLLGRFLKIFSSETACPNEPKLFKQELSFFNREDILEINQSEKIIACGGHVCSPIGTK